jgi:hypothetical protein
MDDRVGIEELDCGEHAVFEFLFGFNTDVAEHRAREFGEEAFDEVEPRAVLRRECAVTAREVIMK